MAATLRGGGGVTPLDYLVVAAGLTLLGVCVRAAVKCAERGWL